MINIFPALGIKGVRHHALQKEIFFFRLQASKVVKWVEHSLILEVRKEMDFRTLVVTRPHLHKKDWKAGWRWYKYCQDSQDKQ